MLGFGHAAPTSCREGRVSILSWVTLSILSWFGRPRVTPELSEVRCRLRIEDFQYSREDLIKIAYV
jgi:hypothetical protein